MDLRNVQSGKSPGKISVKKRGQGQWHPALHSCTGLDITWLRIVFGCLLAYKILCQNFNEVPLNGGVKCSWSKKNNNFRLIFCPEMIQDRCCGMSVGTCVHFIEWCHFQWPWLTHNRFQGHDILQHHSNFLLSGSPTVLVFLHMKHYAKIECRLFMKNCDFWPTSHFFDFHITTLVLSTHWLQPLQVVDDVVTLVTGLCLQHLTGWPLLLQMLMTIIVIQNWENTQIQQIMNASIDCCCNE